MQKIAFVVAPFFTRTMPHLGIAYLRASISSKKYSSSYVDFSAKYLNDKLFLTILNNWYSSFSKPTQMTTFFSFLHSIIYYFYPPSDLNPVLRTCQTLIKEEAGKMAEIILQDSPNYVGFTIYNSNIFLSLAIAKELKEKNTEIKTIFGGPFISDRRIQEFLGAFDDIVDYILVGEGELIINELLDKKIANRIIHAEPILNLDNLPYPNFDDIDYSNYFKAMESEKNWCGIAAIKEKILPVMALRGCPYNCSFCDHHVVWKDYRGRSIDNVIKEVIRDREIYNCRIFRFNDSLLNSNPKWLKGFCEALLDNKIKIYWYAHCRADKIDDDIAKLMYQAGCRYIKFGIESGSERVLKIMNKKITPASAERAIESAYKANLKVRCSFIYAYPGETREELKKTIEFIKRNREKFYGIRMYNFMFMPGTPLEIEADKWNIRLINFNLDNFNNKFKNILSNIPQTWQHPEINDEEISARYEMVNEVVSKINNEDQNYLPYMFADAIKDAIQKEMILNYNKDKIIKIETNDENVKIYADCGGIININKLIYDFIEKRRSDSYTNFFKYFRSIYKSDTEAEKTIIGLISLGVLSLKAENFK